jgi:YD repeat-containing protein
MKKLLYLLTITFTCLSSCSTDDTEPQAPIITEVPSYGTAGFLKNIISDNIHTLSGNESTKISTYFYSGTKLTVFGSSDGGHTCNYENDILTSVDTDYTSGNDASSITSLEYDSEGRLITETLNHSYGYTDVSSFEYLLDGRIKKTSTNGDIYYFTFENGNLVKKTHFDASVSTSGLNTVFTYTYDEKNNPFKNVTQAQVFALLDYAHLNKNNILTRNIYYVEMDFNETFEATYTYNSNDFPSISNCIYDANTSEEITATKHHIYY